MTPISAMGSFSLRSVLRDKRLVHALEFGDYQTLHWWVSKRHREGAFSRSRPSQFFPPERDGLTIRKLESLQVGSFMKSNSNTFSCDLKAGRNVA